uniref:Uncharacterized protein n=1 Tax=Romanomermis culicivorax TaxID=13658 RepID=A0A915JPL1_ROMCU
MWYYCFRTTSATLTVSRITIRQNWDKKCEFSDCLQNLVDKLNVEQTISDAEQLRLITVMMTKCCWMTHKRVQQHNNKKTVVSNPLEI